jgi:MFS family permease
VSVPPGAGKKYADRVVEAVTQAFYSRATSSPDTARARAQSAYGIASAVVGGLLGGALIAKLSTLSTWVQLLGVVALSAWLVATSLYVFAVAVPVTLQPAGQPRGQDEFIDAVVRNAVRERTRIDRRQLRANVTAAIAMILTAATFGLALFSMSRETSFPATVYLSTKAGAVGKFACGSGVQEISGRVDQESLDKAFLRIRPDRRVCSRATTKVYVPISIVTRVERTH